MEPQTSPMLSPVSAQTFSGIKTWPPSTLHCCQNHTRDQSLIPNIAIQMQQNKHQALHYLKNKKLKNILKIDDFHFNNIILLLTVMNLIEQFMGTTSGLEKEVILVINEKCVSTDEVVNPFMKYYNACIILLRSLQRPQRL